MDRGNRKRLADRDEVFDQTRKKTCLQEIEKDLSELDGNDQEKMDKGAQENRTIQKKEGVKYPAPPCITEETVSWETENIVGQDTEKGRVKENSKGKCIQGEENGIILVDNGNEINTNINTELEDGELQTSLEHPLSPAETDGTALDNSEGSGGKQPDTTIANVEEEEKLIYLFNLRADIEMIKGNKISNDYLQYVIRSTKNLLKSPNTDIVDKAMKILNEELTCIICLEFYTEPVHYPCQHYYCKKCLTDWRENNKFSCPDCRTVQTEIIKSEKMNLLMKEIEQYLPETIKQEREQEKNKRANKGISDDEQTHADSNQNEQTGSATSTEGANVEDSNSTQSETVAKKIFRALRVYFNK